MAQSHIGGVTISKPSASFWSRSIDSRLAIALIIVASFAAIWVGAGLRVVYGSSMTPTLPTFTIVRGVESNVTVGDVVIARLGALSWSVKRVIDRDEDGCLYLAGDNAERSKDSRDFGWVHPADVKKVVWAAAGDPRRDVEKAGETLSDRQSEEANRLAEEAAKLSAQSGTTIIDEKGEEIAQLIRVDENTVSGDIAVIGDVSDYYKPGMYLRSGDSLYRVVGSTYGVPYPSGTCTNVVTDRRVKAPGVLELYETEHPDDLRAHLGLQS